MLSYIIAIPNDFLNNVYSVTKDDCYAKLILGVGNWVGI